MGSSADLEEPQGLASEPQKPWSFLSEVTKPLPMTAMWIVLSPSAWPVGWEESTRASAQAAMREICPIEHNVSQKEP